MKAHRRSWIKIVSATLIVLVIVVAGGLFAAWRIYQQNLEPVSSLEQNQSFIIDEGATAGQIASSLEEAKLIRSSWAFEWYVRREGARELLKAGSYSLSPSMSVGQIVAILTQGKIATDLVTILPGQRLDQIRDALIIDYDFPEAEVDAALDPNAYAHHPVLAEKPPGASLEGFLYPESFHKTSETTVKDIIKGSLDQMHKVLTPELKNAIVQQGLTVYQGLTLASIIEKEVSSAEDQKQVAQVFLTRLRDDIALESNATAPYGAVLAGHEPSDTFHSAYNTYLHKGLPPTPISNVDQSALQAVAHPAQTDYLYFFSGDDGKTYFSHTLEEHQSRARQLCTRLCHH